MIKPTILIVAAVIASPFLSAPRTYKAIEPEIALAAPIEVVKAEQTIWTETEILDIAREMADKYGVSREAMARVTFCEAPWHMDGSGVRIYDKNDAQSRLTYNEGQIRRHPIWGKVGERENSFGPGQIHLPDNPEVSQDEAVDPYFAAEFMAKAFKNGKKDLWTCK